MNNKKLFKKGDVAWCIWVSDEPILIRHGGKKVNLYLPKPPRKVAIMMCQDFDKKLGCWRYRVKEENGTITTAAEDELAQSLEQAESSLYAPLSKIIAQAIRFMVECGTSSGFGSKTKWREILDSAILELYKDENNGKSN